MSLTSKLIKKQIQEWKARGLIKEITNENKLENVLKEKLSVYCGFDPTAASLHIGHLIPLQLLRELSRWGCPIIVLIGSGTALVGDPSFTQKVRKVIDQKTIQKNHDAIVQQIHTLLPNASIRNNLEWYKKMSFLDFLYHIGKSFTIHKLLERQNVREAYKKGFLTYNQFSYILLQAYDFFYLSKHDDCYLQVGGSDQYPNIAFGIDFIKKIAPEQSKKVVGITTSLLSVKAGGKKISKSENKTKFELGNMQSNAYSLFQNLLNISDQFLFLENCQINNTDHNNFKKLNNLKNKQAFYIIEWIFGLKKTQQLTRALAILKNCEANFLNKNLSIEDEDWKCLMIVLGVKKIKKSFDTIKNVLFNAKIVSSLSEGRRLIEQGGIKIINRPINDVFYKIQTSDLYRSHLILRIAKKKYYLISFED